MTMATPALMARIVHVTTVPITLRFLAGHVRHARAQGCEVHCVSSPGPELQAFAQTEGAHPHAVEMTRRITPWKDLVALFRLTGLLRRLRPDVVHAHTPKGGLLGMTAAFLARVPVRIYHVHGLPFMTSAGARRRLLRLTERAGCGMAHRVLCVSPSIALAAIEAGLVNPSRVRVPHHGSIDGVDALERFDPSGHEGARDRIRSQLGIPHHALVIGFVGRVVHDKGVSELVKAWREVNATQEAHLLLVGPYEETDPVPPDVRDTLDNAPGVHLAGFVVDAAPYYAAMDVLVLPSHREGFGLAAIEASAMGVPVVATRIPGCVDAVADASSGTLVPAGDAVALARAIQAYLKDPGLRARHGQAGRERAIALFEPHAVRESTFREYVELLVARGRMSATSAGQAAQEDGGSAS